MTETILNHFGFSRLPFGKDIRTDQVFITDALSQATSMIEFGLDSEDIILITGPIGCGKSLIVRHAVSSFDANHYQTIYLRGSIDDATELCKLVLQGMKVDPPHSSLKAKTRFFTAVSEATRKPVVILDDAQDVATEALLSIKTMTNFESDSRNRITFILVGQPELVSLLELAHFDSLRARIRLTHHLKSMSIEETCAYIEHGLAIVERKESLFSDSAKMEIFKRTNGIARDVNRICYQAIVNGAIEEKRLIDTQDLPSDSF